MGIVSLGTRPGCWHNLPYFDSSSILLTIPELGRRRWNRNMVRIHYMFCLRLELLVFVRHRPKLRLVHIMAASSYSFWFRLLHLVQSC